MTEIDRKEGFFKNQNMPDSLAENFPSNSEQKSIGYLHFVIVIHKKCFDINVLIKLLKNEPGVMLHIHIHFSQIVIQVDVNTFYFYVISTTITNPYFSFLTFSEKKNFNNGCIFTIKVTKKLPNVES